MSGFSSIAVPGNIPTAGSGKSAITPDALFKNGERQEYQNVIDRVMPGGRVADVEVKKVKVEIFDLSDQDQVKKYEKLWTELLKKAMKMEVVVDSRKDLVHRADGTSYWMRYVEYVEFGESQKKEKERKGDE